MTKLRKIVLFALLGYENSFFSFTTLYELDHHQILNYLKLE